MHAKIAFHVLSRLKGIETAKNFIFNSPSKNPFHVLSRLKGIETLPQQRQGFYLICQNFPCAFPFEGN